MLRSSVNEIECKKHFLNKCVYILYDYIYDRDAYNIYNYLSIIHIYITSKIISFILKYCPHWRRMQDSQL